MAAERQTDVRQMLVPDDQPLIGLRLQQDGREVVCYFTDESDAEVVTEDEIMREALAAIGALC